MDRLRAGTPGGVEDALDVQIAVARGGGADGDGAIGGGDMHRLGIGFRIDRDGFDAHAPRGAGDAAGDFTAIGNQQGADHPRLAHLGLGSVLHRHHIRNTPNFVGSIGAFSAAERDRPSTRRVSAGSMIPSSHSRAVA